MARYKKILVAYDGSESAKNALRQASRLAKADNSWIKVVAVVPSYEGDLDFLAFGDTKDLLLGPGERLLVEAKAIADAEDVHILTDLEQGEPYERIVHVAQEERCDLIVMGRRGLTHLERELIGGVTARVIGHTAKDVLVFPEGAQFGRNRLLLATDGSAFSSAAVDRALELAAGQAADLMAVSVVNINEEFASEAPGLVKEMVASAHAVLEEVTRRAGSHDITVQTKVGEGEPHEIILKFAAGWSAELILMGSHGRKGLTRLLMGSVTERVIGLAHCPVLVSHRSPS